MEVKLVWEEEALSSIHKTFEYISQFSLQSASKLAIELVEFGNSIAILPLKFSVCSHRSLKKLGLRCVSFRNHIFVYEVSDKQVSILRVFHSKQNPRKFKITS